VTAGRHLVFPFLAAFLLTTKPEKSIADNITAAGVFQKHSKPVEKELFTRTNPMCELVEGIVTVPLSLYPVINGKKLVGKGGWRILRGDA
jgi:hypothetical protein